MAAGDEPVNFNRRSADLIGRTIKEFRGRGRGELPLPPRRRNPGGGSGGSDAGGSLTFMVLTEGCSIAFGDTDSITPGAGRARFYQNTFVADVLTRTPDMIRDPVVVYNFDPSPSTAYVSGTGIWVSQQNVAEIEGGILYEIVAVNCEAYAAPA